MDRFPEPRDGWEQDVWLLSRRMALMYYYMAKAMVERLGVDEGRKLVSEAIWAYGEACGERVKEGVVGQGLPLDGGNFHKVPDLPSKGWREETVSLPDGRSVGAAVLCPLAVTWKELAAQDPAAESLGRLYCLVDQAKFKAYNPALRVVHTRNVLDGDEFCVIDVVKDQPG